MEQPDLLAAYACMLRCRGFEERVQRLFAANAVRGSCHLGIGQEAVAVGARYGTRPGDVVWPTYRGHNYVLAWGVSLEQAFAELLGRDTGMARGRGGSKHFGSAQHGVFPSNAIVAANVALACGSALAAQLRGRDQVTVVPFGDGATNQAVWHEALNLAAVWSLPMILLCENNVYSEMTPISDMVRVIDLADRADAYGLRASIVDGMDLPAVVSEVQAAAEYARQGGGPTLIEAKTYRFCGHMTGDGESYRSQDEVLRWRSRDPVTATAAALRAGGVAADALTELEQQVAAELAAAEQAAGEAPLPAPADIALGTAPFMAVSR